ncbi:hypothetical protein D3C76_718400 [compost metagenome]
MTYGYVMKNMQHMEYLGFCELKGFMYTEYMGDGQYRILALNNGTVTIMINYTGVKKEEAIAN